jgi:hypothetical protein
MRSFIFSAAAVSALLKLAAAQTFTDCNPLQKSQSPPFPKLLSDHC